MSQFDLNQLSKKTKNLSVLPNTNCLKTGNQEEEAESLIQEILPAIHEKPKERDSGTDSFWSSNCLGEFFQRERTL